MNITFKSPEQIDAEVRAERQSVLGEYGGFDVEDEVVPEFNSERWYDKVWDGSVYVPKGFAWDEEWILVGHGKRTKRSCGSFAHPQVKHLIGCLRMGNHAKVGLDGVDYTGKIPVKRVFYSCDKPSCPACYARGYAVRSSKRAERRLLHAYAKGHGKAEHIIVSFSPKLGVSFEELRKLALEALKVRGVTGGCWVYHHFRFRNKAEAFRSGKSCGWYKSPHFHIVGFLKGGYGNCRKCANAFLDDDGDVVVKNRQKCVDGCNGFEGVTRRANVKDGCIVKVKAERKSVGGTLWYELNHASIRRNPEKGKRQQIVNWFGVCGRNKLKMRKGSMPQHENMCPICGEKMYKIRLKKAEGYRELLAFMRQFPNSHVFLLNMYDEDGNARFEAVYDEKRGG